MSIEAKIDMQSVMRRISSFQEGALDFATANRQVATQLYSWVLTNYEGEGRRVGGWAPLSPKTVKAKLRKGYSTKILLRTGAMRQNFAQFSDREQAGVGNRTSYSLYHEEGRGLPQRRMMPNADEMNSIGLRVYDLFLKNAARTTLK